MDGGQDGRQDGGQDRGEDGGQDGGQDVGLPESWHHQFGLMRLLMVHKACMPVYITVIQIFLSYGQVGLQR